MLPSAFVLALLLAQAPDPLTEGTKALDANQPAAAEPLFRKAVESDPTDVNAHFNLALALSLQQKDEPAIAELRKVLELKPGLYEANLNLGVLLLRNHQAGDALAVLRPAVEAKPTEARPNSYYAQAALETGNLDEAEKYFRIVRTLDPKAGPAGLLQVAAAYSKAGDTAKAVLIYKEFPESPGVKEYLAGLNKASVLALADQYTKAKQPAKALEQLQIAVQLDPADYDLRMNIGRLLRDDHKFIPAAQQFLAASKLRPDDASAWNELASALIINENYAEGLAALDRVRALGKEIPGDLYLRAITLDKLKQKPQALAVYQQFLAADRGAHADQDFLARQRIRIIESELKRK